jgi:hypothetical protein
MSLDSASSYIEPAGVYYLTSSVAVHRASHTRQSGHTERSDTPSASSASAGSAVGGDGSSGGDGSGSGGGGGDDSGDGDGDGDGDGAVLLTVVLFLPRPQKGSASQSDPAPTSSWLSRKITACLTAIDHGVSSLEAISAGLEGLKPVLVRLLVVLLRLGLFVGSAVTLVAVIGVIIRLLVKAYS